MNIFGIFPAASLRLQGAMHWRHIRPGAVTDCLFSDAPIFASQVVEYLTL